MTRQDLTDEVADLIGLPHMKGHGTAYKVVGVIIKAIIEGIRKDGRVAIDGFGIFEVYERPATRTAAYFYPYLGKGHHCEIIELPPTKRVIFKPSKPLQRLLNG